MDRDERYMQMAIEMAKETVGQTSPNPAVAAIVVNRNQVVGVGVHVKAGEPHAEIHALRMAGDKAIGAEIYVTLEPCSHYGQTPPCAEAVIKAGIHRAVIASEDPNPKVSGRGIRMMKENGLEVKTQVLKEEADQLNRSFFHYIQTKQPYVRLKTAMSLDGKIATSTGESQWITGEEARKDGHLYRHQSDAILVGINTVLMDNPKLTTRIDGNGRHPIRIILDTHLKTPPSSQLIQDDQAPTWIFVGAKVGKEREELYEKYEHVRIISLENDQVSIDEVLQYLGEHKVTSLLVEGGATIADAFVRAGKVDETITYMAPKLIGGKEALTPVGGEGIQQLKNARAFVIVSTEKMGDDIKIVSVRKGES
ncbi:diaminohydroxyphosphoribosylaminopyrimidine deaminase / 5-amino-6-(5-phosphoribosylamino)uracil reductase [Halobacillus karajensis]|uniref:Riboflavin biosynthesis protein RibD n=1 Tax=Halobacillus karajensis TaxID=195088 RepID=A0A024P5B8_9BACI|nr:bifunctional diaminohydroxyphosphoribosylaminopyrimidine deaminase/5-amino-6-(5-phosphoribosylamino)uracil reductase RibD [Halobacillus karajensis]CDQ18756.1 Riboflavin biosynthesis protein RibD [Halobacillus karajensis]CDQ23172.1 Riboflavin biosynthesis protein RibD [Halobacillus karajensis]CDQ26654.1 Riboflavin biosynthesis protein RibD [Halobacillus karajensis]SEH46668.1 diaminohydroxyphosphoribosylaminopyrimidine deaminase / 5-amino-6-(5-phosphoribosylamino)uracil reductase [Halobacillus